MLSISDVLLAGRGVITGPGVISAAVLVCQDGDKLQAHLQPLRWCAVRWCDLTWFSDHWGGRGTPVV